MAKKIKTFIIFFLGILNLVLSKTVLVYEEFKENKFEKKLNHTWNFTEVD